MNRYNKTAPERAAFAEKFSSESTHDKVTDFCEITQAPCVGCPKFCRCGYPLWLECWRFMRWRRGGLCHVD